MPINESTLSVRLPTEMYDRLKEKATSEERSIAGVFRLLVRAYLDAPPDGGDHYSTSLR